MFSLFKTKPLLDDFYLQHKIADDKEHLLNIGAMLLEYNEQRDSLTLKSRLKTAQLEPLLNSAWEIYNRKSCIELLNGLLQLPNQQKHSQYVNAILLQKQNVDQLAYEVLVNPANLYKCLERNCQSLFEENGAAFDRIQFDGIGNITAWDIERAGLIARYAFNIGWINEVETLACLERLFTLAKSNYRHWADYYVAYMKARTLFYEERETDYIDYVYTLKEMYAKPDSFCLKYPLTIKK